MKARDIPPVLILSTGRCGSTMVSEMLNRHPDVLSLSEFFMPLGQNAFAWEQPTGERIWHTLSRQSPTLHAMLKDGLVVDEGLYPYDDPAARFSAHDMPPIIATALPHLTPDYEALYDALEEFVRPRPKAPLEDQYRALFGHLMDRLGRRVWVERSGGSLMLAAKLLRLFPDARVVHVYRDGRDTAISMSRHHNFRVLLAIHEKCRRLGLDLRRDFLKDRGSRAGILMEKLFFSLVDTKALLRTEPDLADYGAFWSDMILTGKEILGDLPPSRLLNVRFEDVQQAPRETLSDLIGFIDPSLHNEAWLEETVAMLRPTRAKYTELPADQQAALTEACLPGLRHLGYAT